MQHAKDAHDSATHAATSGSYFVVPESVTAKQFPFPGAVFELDASLTVNQSLRLLGQQNVLSAPVWDAANKKYLGFLDVGDILGLAYGIDMLVSMLPENMIKKQKSIEVPEVTVGSLFEEGSTSTSWTKWCPVTPDAPFKEVLRLLATETRRVPVVDPSTGKVVKIISQSAVVTELYKRIKELGDKAPSNLLETPKSTGIGLKAVMCIGEDDPARDAYMKITTEGCSAVGVLDNDKKLLTTITTKDVRLLPRIEAAGLEGGSLLNMSAREYVSAIRLATEKDGKAHPSVVSVQDTTPLVSIIGRLAETRLHRVFIVDSTHRPVGVISVSDIIVLLMEEQNVARQKAPAAGSGSSA